MPEKLDKPRKLPPYYQRQKALVDRIKKEQGDRRIDVRVMAAEFGVSYSHMTGILSGERWAASCDRPVIQAMAKFLRVPVLQVYFWCGFLDPEDAVVTHGLQERLALTLRKMEIDPLVSTLAPSQEAWDNTPIEVRLSFAMVYEAYAEEALLEHAKIEMSEAAAESVGVFIKKGAR